MRMPVLSCISAGSFMILVLRIVPTALALACSLVITLLLARGSAALALLLGRESHRRKARAGGLGPDA